MRTKMIDYCDDDYEGVAEMFKGYGHLPGQPLEMLVESEKATYVIYDDKAKFVDLIEVNHGRSKNKPKFGS